ncbi:hypothetical protein KCU91_g12141, partial [Aureobasidium melanogenum]
MSVPETTKRPAEDVADSSEDESRPPRKKHLPKRTCLVCDVEKGINQFPSSKRVSSHDHGSNVCRPCFLRHVEVEIDSKNWDQVACPECEIVLEYNEVKKMTSAEKFEKYEEASLRAALAEDGDYRHCFSPTCNAGQLHTGSEDEPIFRCGTCGHKHCVACEANWHEDETCTQCQDRRRVERGVENDQSQQEVEKLSKPCPKCKVPIEKNYGCDHMTYAVTTSAGFAQLNIGKYSLKETIDMRKVAHTIVRFHPLKSKKLKDAEQKKRDNDKIHSLAT